MRGLTNYVLIPLTFIGALNWGLVGIFGFIFVWAGYIGQQHRLCNHWYCGVDMVNMDVYRPACITQRSLITQ